MCLPLLPTGRRGVRVGSLHLHCKSEVCSKDSMVPLGTPSPAWPFLLLLHWGCQRGCFGRAEPVPSSWSLFHAILYPILSHWVLTAKSPCKRAVVHFSLLRSLVAYLFLGLEKAEPAQVILAAWVMLCMYCCDQKALLPNVSYGMRWQPWLIRVHWSMPAVWEVFQKHWNCCHFVMDGGSQGRIFVGFLFSYQIKYSQKNRSILAWKYTSLLPFFFPMYFVDWTTLGYDWGSSKAGMWQMVLQTQLGERISKETWLRSLLFYFLLRDQSLTAERLGVTMWGWPNIVMCITLKHGTSLQHVIPHATEHHVLTCLCRRDPCHLLLPSVLPCHAAGWEEGGNSCWGMSKTS